TGPSTGMPTRTQQGDLLLCAYASHGDTKHILLFPADPGECFDFAVRAFDLAERFQTPVFVLSDLDIGMNDWMVPRLQWNDAYRPDRGKVLGAEELEALEKFNRYVDADGDGVAARTLPGVHAKGAFFTRGSGHNKFGGYTEDAAEYSDVMTRLTKKMETAAQSVPVPAVSTTAGARAAIVSLGGCHRAIVEAVELLGARGITVDYMRLRGFPFAPEVGEFIRSHQRVFVVEQNRDGQLASLLAIETGFARERLQRVGTFGGLPLSACDVVEGIVAALRGAEEPDHEARLPQAAGDTPVTE
ncbi:MAG: 2-oxoacid:acceptor oxidoreductase subunit alpha, partial [Gemmatimonadaceae bacterium]